MNENIQQKMVELQNHYRQQLPQRLNEVKALWHLVEKNKSPETAQQLLRALHNMAGSGTTFGLPKITEIARHLEKIVQEAFKAEHKIKMADIVPKVEAGLDALFAVAGDPTAASNVALLKPSAPKAAQRADSDRRLIYLVDDDVELGKAIALQIHCFGYDVRGFTNLKSLIAAAQKVQPTAIIMDLGFPEGEYSGANAIAALRKNVNNSLPVIYLTTHGEFQARLTALRAGCDGYFLKPANVSHLIDHLDHVLSRDDDDPYRILIVDDSASTAEFTALTLQNAGMKTLVVTDPSQVLRYLEDFSPELILMDMYMPQCSGAELAQIIRQLPEFVSIPIVYLSGEHDLKKQLTAMRHGGDDFLTKPIDPEHLVASVSIRAERYRALRGLMIHDGLTGLLNHSRIEEELNAELSRSTREGKPLAFVMVDLDNFKSVNDTYGHLVGDRVLRSLSRLLKERLRKTDRIGRYGGEEFAVILPNTVYEQAVTVMDNIRDAFSKILHQADDDREFTVTMSCGIACYHGDGTPPEIGKLADNALYQAKHEGRNRVVVASA